MTHAASSKTPPVDADELPLLDSATSFSLKKLTWANIKAALNSVYMAYVAPSTSGNVLTSNGSAWISAAPASGGGITAHGNSDYSIATTDNTIETTTTLTATRTWTLPGASAVAAGKTITINDTAMAIVALTYNLIIARSGSDTIDGATQIVLYAPGSSLTLQSDGVSRWKILNIYGSKIGYCHVNRNGTNQTGATGGVTNKIQFTNEVSDINAWFDNATNYCYTPLIAGLYQVILSVRSTANGDLPQTTIFRNGAPASSGPYWSGGGGTGQIYTQYSDVIFCNGSSDYIEGFVYLPSGVTTISGEVGGTFMKIFRL